MFVMVDERIIRKLQMLYVCSRRAHAWSYLNHPVLSSQPRQFGGRSGVEGADVLPRTEAGAVQVEAVAFFGTHHVAQAGRQLRGVGFLWL